MGDAEYIAAFQQVIMPIAYEYNPELVLVSAGFDAAAGDPLGGYRITPEGYAHMTHMLSSLAQGKIVLALEVSTTSQMIIDVNKSELRIEPWEIQKSKLRIEPWGTPEK